MVQDKLKADLKRLANSQLVTGLSKQLNVYEKRVKELVSNFDLKSREAREKSRKQLDKFANQVKRTRDDVEKRFRIILTQEGKRLNKGVGDLVSYFKSMANNERIAQAYATHDMPSKKRKTRTTSTGRKTKKTTKTKRRTGR